MVGSCTRHILDKSYGNHFKSSSWCQLCFKSCVVTNMLYFCYYKFVSSGSVVPDMLINEYPHIHRCNVIRDMLVVMHVIIDVTLFSKLCCPRYASPWSLQLVYRSFMLSHICSLSVKTSLLQKARRCPRYASFWFAPIGFQQPYAIRYASHPLPSLKRCSVVLNMKCYTMFIHATLPQICQLPHQFK